MRHQLSHETIIPRKIDQITITDEKLVFEQETQTDRLSEDMKYCTPDDVGKRKNKKEESEDKLPPAKPRILKGDLPLQIKRVVDFSQKSKSNSISSKNSSMSDKKPEFIKGFKSARTKVLCKPQHIAYEAQKPSTSRHEYNNLPYQQMEQEFSKDLNEEEFEEIRFSIHGDSSVEESWDEEDTDSVDKKKSQSIRIPQFKISKTYDKRASSHNFRYI
jgi:hypothetical protein